MPSPGFEPRLLLLKRSFVSSRYLGIHHGLKLVFVLQVLCLQGLAGWVGLLMKAGWGAVLAVGAGLVADCSLARPIF